MRISDWSSDVCSSDLLAQPVLGGGRGRAAHRDRDADALHPGRARARLERGEIGTHGEAARRIVRLIEGAYPFEHPELVAQPRIDLHRDARRLIDLLGLVDRTSTRLNSSH